MWTQWFETIQAEVEEVKEKETGFRLKPMVKSSHLEMLVKVKSRMKKDLSRNVPRMNADDFVHALLSYIVRRSNLIQAKTIEIESRKIDNSDRMYFRESSTISVDDETIEGT